MTRIILACSHPATCRQVAGLLNQSGLPVCRECGSGDEVRRAFQSGGDGVVVLYGRLMDCTPTALAWDLGERAILLAVGRPDFLSSCDHPQIFRLEAPCSGAALAAAVQMLTQLHQTRLPRRAGKDKAVVDRAKEYLMVRYGITEPEAHRYLQKYAMDHGEKLTDCAAKLLASPTQGRELT